MYKRLIHALEVIQCLKEQFEALHARIFSLDLHSNNTTLVGLVIRHYATNHRSSISISDQWLDAFHRIRLRMVPTDVLLAQMKIIFFQSSRTAYCKLHLG